ncbi:MAG TPA: glucose-6-phosphate isomerase family protein [Nitrososphaerales archaeon]|nr:glucose-6-phosphate isomerase family protein [Nitrososphaerales archaeon]
MTADGDVRAPSIRYLNEMDAVLYDRQFAVEADPRLELYYMYKDVTKKRDRPTFEVNELRFDITIMPGHRLGKEFNKTLGQVHEAGPRGFSYPEVYEVISGRAHYLMQQMRDEDLSRVVLVEAREGERVLIQPGWWHFTINPSSEPLVMSNLLWRGVLADYDPIRRHKGAAYYELHDGSFVRNTNYERVPELSRTRASPELAGRTAANRSLYSSFVESPETYRYLTHPEDFQSMWRSSPGHSGVSSQQ